MKNERLLPFVMAGISFTTIMDFMIMMPLGPQFKRIFDIGPEMWSAVISSYTFAAAVSGFAAIFFLDAFDRRKALLFMYAGFIVATFLVGLAPNIYLLLAARALTGLFGGIIGALLLAIVGDLVPGPKRGKAIGIVMTGFSAAASLGVPLGLLIGTTFGWRFAFFMIAGFSMLLYVLAWKIVPHVNAHLGRSGSIMRNSINGIKAVVTDGNQLLALLFMVLIVFGQFSIIPFISPYMVANVGFEEMELTYIYLAGGTLTVFTSPWFGKIADRRGKHRTFGVLMLLSLIPIYAITNMEPIPIAYVLIFSSMFFVFAAGRMIPASALVLSTAHPDYRGTFMSIRSVAVSLGQGIAAYCAGLIIFELPDGTLSNFSTVGYIGIGTSIASYFILRKLVDRY
jgi:predicted MFS family arabinose efflux permease